MIHFYHLSQRFSLSLLHHLAHIKQNKMKNLNNDGLDPSSSDESDNDSDNDSNIGTENDESNE